MIVQYIHFGDASPDCDKAGIVALPGKYVYGKLIVIPLIAEGINEDSLRAFSINVLHLMDKGGEWNPMECIRIVLHDGYFHGRDGCLRLVKI